MNPDSIPVFKYWTVQVQLGSYDVEPRWHCPHCGTVTGSQFVTGGIRCCAFVRDKPGQMYCEGYSHLDRTAVWLGFRK
jgi:hypothetical protein